MLLPRCLECNTKLIVITKESIKDPALSKAIQYYQDFKQCSECNKIYWEGSHYQKMQNFLDSIRKKQ